MKFDVVTTGEGVVRNFVTIQQAIWKTAPGGCVLAHVDEPTYRACKDRLVVGNEKKEEWIGRSGRIYYTYLIRIDVN